MSPVLPHLWSLQRLFRVGCEHQNYDNLDPSAECSGLQGVRRGLLAAEPILHHAGYIHVDLDLLYWSCRIGKLGMARGCVYKHRGEFGPKGRTGRVVFPDRSTDSHCDRNDRNRAVDSRAESKGAAEATQGWGGFKG